MAILQQYDWLLALITIAFCASSFGNGANDVANAYATSVAARTMTMPQVGVLSAVTEFVGAVALGSRVTKTIKNGIIDIGRFENEPGVLMLAMTCAEYGSASWLILATSIGFPVSTTQTIVGSLVGVGIASQAAITWEWDSGSVSQVAASWGIAPALAACFAAILFGTVKFLILERKDPFKLAMILIPFYVAFTSGVLALFITIESVSDEFETDIGVGKTVGIILGVFFAMLALSYIFFIPYLKRRVVQNDARIRVWHLPLGPLLLKENPPLYFPGDSNGEAVKDYYQNARTEVQENGESYETSLEKGAEAEEGPGGQFAAGERQKKVIPEPEERWLHPVRDLPLFHPRKIMNWTKYILLQGVSRDCVSHDNEHLEKTHGLAIRYDNRVEHLWTYCQVLSAIMMSIAHGSNDVANAAGPWVATYNTYISGEVSTKSPTPVWILVVAGFLLGAGFWFLGFKIVRALGNRITRVSPTRGFSIELGAAITVLLASRLGLPVSTTQCLTGATLGVALMNFQLGAVNWRQLLFILFGWILTLPCAGLISGLLMVMALNTPQF